MKTSTRLVLAIIAALVLPFVVPGFVWLLPHWLPRAFFTFIVVYVWGAFFNVRAHVSIMREREPRKMAFWGVVVALIITACFTVIWSVIVTIFGWPFGIHTREDVFRSMVFFGLVSFTGWTYYFFRKNYVI
jgi:hypothetical protein